MFENMRRLAKTFTWRLLLSIIFIYLILQCFPSPHDKSLEQFNLITNSTSIPIKTCTVIGNVDKLNVSSNCSFFLETIRRTGFSVSACNGRLGNQLGLAVLGFALHSQFGVKLILEKFQYGVLDKVFDMKEICRVDGTSFCVFNQLDCVTPKTGIEQTSAHGDIWERGIGAFGQLPSDLKGKRVNLPVYPQYLPLIMRSHVADFRSQMLIKKHIWTNSEKVFDYLTLNSTNCRPPDCVLAAVHIRMGDYAVHLFKMGYKPDLMKTDYLQSAFNYTMSKYKTVVFLIFCEKDAELRQYISSHKDSFPASMRMVIVGPERDRIIGADNKELSLGVDFAVMSMADVLIMTYGTFGLFAALLTKDKHEVLYPKNHVSHNETGVNRGFPRFTAIPWKVT